jgi:hypothetical protein
LLFNVLVYCAKKNLATLSLSEKNRKAGKKNVFGFAKIDPEKKTIS